MKEITVVDVFRELNAPTDKRLTWRAGALVREAYRQRTGNDPVLKNRPKTSGHGTHAFAVYPVTFKRRITEIVKKVVDQNAGLNELQQSLL